MDLYEESLKDSGLFLEKLERNIRIKPLTTNEQFEELRKLPKAIVYIKAEWSGPEKVRRPRVYTAMSHVEVRKVPGYYVDIDKLPPEFEQQLRNYRIQLHGYGEVFFFEQGRCTGFMPSKELMPNNEIQETLLEWVRRVPNQWPVPKTLRMLIDCGVWPTNYNNVVTNPLQIPIGRLKDTLPEENEICLYAYPFFTIAEQMRRLNQLTFYSEFGSIEELDTDKALEIGDFGPGSDALIVLDYRYNETEPAVLAQKWENGTTNWVQIAANFDEFAAMTRLDKMIKRL